MREPLLMRIHVSTVGSPPIAWDRSGDDPPLGYFQTIGATADDSDDLHGLVKAYVAGDAGGQLVEIDDLRVAELAGRDRDIRDCCGDPSIRGVWYASGRAFYSDWDDNDDGVNE